HSGQTVSWSDIGPLAASGSKSLEIVAHIDGPISGIKTLTNRVDVEGKPEHGQNVTNSSTADVNAEGANIMVQKTADPTFGSVGILFNFTMNVTNNGAALLQNVSVSDKLPSGLTYASSSTGSVNSGQYVNWTEIGPMSVGDMKSLWIKAKIDGTVYGTLTNLVFVTGKPPSGDPVTNSTTKDVIALNLRAISGRKFNDLDGDGAHDGDLEPGLPGWTIELVNQTTGRVVISIITNESGLYRMDNVTLGKYTVREVQQPGWRRTCPAQGNYSVTVVHSDVNEVDFGNQRMGEISRINVTKIAYPTSASPGAEISFVVNILNNGETHLSHVKARDILPAGMSYVSDNRSGSVSGRVISWNDLIDLDPGASNAIRLAARIDRNISGMLINVVYVNATDPAGGEVNDSAIARVRSLLPKIKVNKTLEPVQYGQYCEAKTLRGVGIIESRTSIEDKTIALEYDDALAGEGKIELESAQAMSEAAKKLQRDVPSLDPGNQSRMNFFEETKLAFQGAKPLTGEKSIHSMAFYGGSGAKIKNIFSVEEMEKVQTIHFGSTDQASSPHMIGTDLKSSFNGTMVTDSRMHNMFRRDIKSRQLFSGVFNLDKVIKLHKNATTDELKMGCDGIDC
ncbi:MAG: SpaA isopeptide-forming pilin-related protein, partial [Methanothrix sp.]|nr:SpaA isopeptide-forming pilin-related protein [Methanothrix sp.]